MRIRNGLFRITLLAILLGTLTAAAADNASVEAEVQSLREQLHQSDAAIKRLSQRLEQLERADTTSIHEVADPNRPLSFNASDGDVESIGFTESLVDEFPILGQRLDTVEKAWKKQEETNKKLSMQTRSFRPSSRRRNFKIGGRIHDDFWAFPQADAGAAAFEGGDPENRWAFRRIRLEIDGKVIDNMVYRFQVEFADPQVPSTATCTSASPSFRCCKRF